MTTGIAHAQEKVDLAALRDSTVVGPDVASGVRLAISALHAQAQEITRLLGETVATLSNSQALFEPEMQSAVLAQAARNTIPRWHFAMLNDEARNAALSAALEACVPPGAVVLDIGTGTGLLAMGAVKAGASHVYTCEANPLLAEMARQNIAGHGMADRVTVLNSWSTGLEVGRELPHRVDVLVSEIVDCGLIGEGLLPSVRHARERLLAPDGVMMPFAARLRGQLVNSQAMANLNHVQYASGFDVSLLNKAATQGHFPVRLETWPHRTLSDPVELAAFDLHAGELGPGTRTLTVSTTDSGEAHGLVAWFELELSDGIVLSNAPANVGSHWMQAMIPLEKPVPVVAGETCHIDFGWSDFRLSAS
ncbi:50S ribosomal protein L11 methyltransferase [Streptomyces sp. NPDC090442]|uniref:50S ribosomal protein L11 methyltransferase n=1 Tax=Streptomyces sp. NPDC090442 TaxID=3365962 RepID=UPI00380D46C6